MARNQVDRRNLLDSKMVPQVAEHWQRQAEPVSRPVRQQTLCTVQSQSGQMRPVATRLYGRNLAMRISAIALEEVGHGPARLELDEIHDHGAPQES